MTAMTKTLASHVGGAWVTGKTGSAGEGKPSQLVNPTTEAVLAETSTEGVDMRAAVTFARDVGGKALRALTFKERGEALRKVSRAIHAHRDELIALAIENAGNTRGDAKFDIDGASATLAAYADLGTELGDTRLLVDGEPSNIGRSSKLTGQHVWTPRQGVAVHINAFNFPAWGLAEKAAVALLAGVPVLSKPATSTALMAHRLVEIIVEEDLLPRGALSFLAGSTNDLVDHLDHQDVLAFTGSGAVGAQLRGSQGVVARSVRVNVEADSLNAAILGPDAEPGSETFDLFLRDVVRDVVQKAGQKCTAIRRVFVPKDRLDAVREAIVERLADVKVGDPSRDDVGMGPLATKKQWLDVKKALDAFVQQGAKMVFGGPEGRCAAPIGAPPGKGFFLSPILLECASLDAVPAIHAHEVFGPSTTLLPYEAHDAQETQGAASRLVDVIRRGGGGLVASLYSDDKAFTRALVFGIASAHGRLVLGSEKIAAASIPPGTVMPNLVHGGPGRAGGGEELGGLRGLSLYLQRTAIQGYGPLVASLVADGKRIG